MIHDVIIVGGGPAGSTCARFLVQGGARVAIVDRAQFPRVKLCGGWISAPIWDVLQLAPSQYPGGLWEWRTCHVSYGGESRAIPCHGWFIRRFELDDFLLRRSGAELHLGVSVQDITRDADGLWSVAGLRARHLVGAGGTHCPVARRFPPPRPSGPVGVQEHEFRADPAAIARTRAGADGEPELLLHDDLRGYSWNVPKTDWLNVGAGTIEPHEVRAAWQKARAHFLAAGHVPLESAGELEAMKGHTYYLFDPAHLDGAAHAGGVLLVGDGLGLAQPLTAEGILPSVISGRTAAEAILAGAAAEYPARLAAHPVIQDYRRVYRAVQAAASFVRRAPGPSAARDGGGTRFARQAVARGFAWMFSGARLPAPRLVDAALAAAETWTKRRSERVS
ncbi:MAG TPA: FAD-dependent monooxygenase [Polyangia bacterium]|nr:FAD-dependent monooxygenase [Polyangia bacterium]